LFNGEGLITVSFIGEKYITIEPELSQFFVFVKYKVLETVPAKLIKPLSLHTKGVF
jgi:hypothetical protein